MKCLVCGNEMTYSRDTTNHPMEMIGDFGCTGSSTRTYYTCTCGAHYEKSRWYIPENIRATAKQNYLMEKLMRNIYFLLSSDDAEQNNLYRAISKEHHEAITKKKASIFIDRYCNITSTQELMNLPFETKTVKVYNDIVITDITK